MILTTKLDNLPMVHLKKVTSFLILLQKKFYMWLVEELMNKI